MASPREFVSVGIREKNTSPPHKSNRKITLPWATESLYPVPNIQNHGTRNLGIIRVEPPKPILEAYQPSRQYALNRRQRRPKVHG